MQEDIFQLGIKALITNNNGEILLLKVNQANFQKQGTPYWDLPGGRIKRGDSVEDTLRREVAEETGVTELSNIQEVGMVLSNIRIPQQVSDTGLILAIYQCHIAPKVKITISEEHTDFGWFSPEEAAEMLKVKYPERFCKKIAEL